MWHDKSLGLLIQLTRLLIKQGFCLQVGSEPYLCKQSCFQSVSGTCGAAYICSAWPELDAAAEEGCSCAATVAAAAAEAVDSNAGAVVDDKGWPRKDVA